jgi:hypothetical protein
MPAIGLPSGKPALDTRQQVIASCNGISQIVARTNCDASPASGRGGVAKTLRPGAIACARRTGRSAPTTPAHRVAGFSIDADQGRVVRGSLAFCGNRLEGRMMPEITSPVLSVAALFAEREARRLSEREADEQLKRQREEELAEFKKRLDTFQLTDWHVKTVLDRIKRAFDRGETELMFTSFPSSFCTDGGRAIVNAGAPPINQPDEKDAWANPNGWRPCQRALGRFTHTGRAICTRAASASPPASSTILAACRAMLACSSPGQRTPSRRSRSAATGASDECREEGEASLEWR